MKMAVFWVVAPCRLAIALVMVAARTSETLVNFYQTTWRYNPEDSHLCTHRRENLKSYYVHPCCSMPLVRTNNQSISQSMFYCTNTLKLSHWTCTSMHLIFYLLIILLQKIETLQEPCLRWICQLATNRGIAL
jgi:hypothetical protein